MSKLCEISGVKPFTGNKVSKSNRKTRTRWLPNIKKKRYLIPELEQIITLRLTARTIRTIDKQGGITNAIFKADKSKLSKRLLQIYNKILKKRQSTSNKKAQ